MMDIFIRLPLSAHADRIGVARIFRGCVHPGVHPGFVVGGDDGGAEGPERGAVDAKRRSAEGVRSGEGRRSPSPV